MSAFPAFGPDAEFRELTADGVTMRVVIEGSGPDVVSSPVVTRQLRPIHSNLPG